jgi:hypothetical protein
MLRRELAVLFLLGLSPWRPWQHVHNYFSRRSSRKKILRRIDVVELSDNNAMHVETNCYIIISKISVLMTRIEMIMAISVSRSPAVGFSHMHRMYRECEDRYTTYIHIYK